MLSLVSNLGIRRDVQGVLVWLWLDRLAPLLQERGDRIDRDREDGGRVFLGRDFHQSLQVTELQGRRVSADHLGGIGQAPRGFEFTFGMDDLGATFALRFRPSQGRAGRSNGRQQREPEREPTPMSLSKDALGSTRVWLCEAVDVGEAW